MLSSGNGRGGERFGKPAFLVNALPLLQANSTAFFTSRVPRHGDSAMLSLHGRLDLQDSS